MHVHFTASQLTRREYHDSAPELNACLQCGYCVGKCPTYRLYGEEYESPRGRIYLIKEMLEQETVSAATVAHLDHCLYCLACMSACPSSVHYMHLLDHARGYIEKNYRRPLSDRLVRALLAALLPYPARLRGVLMLPPVLRAIRPLAPKRFRPMLEMLPAGAVRRSVTGRRDIHPAHGPRRLRVGLWAGCVQQVLADEINAATIRLLQRHGCEVVVPRNLGCCGALPQHMGKTELGRLLARRAVAAWREALRRGGLDAIVVNASGCGTMIKDYGHLLADSPDADGGAEVAGLTRDVSELLNELDLNWVSVPPLRVAYHATCSLQYGQRIRYKPKKLLKAAGFRVVEPRHAEQCCGASGANHLLEPQLARRLRDDKAGALRATGAEVVAAGNIGCIWHLRQGTRQPVVHSVELLDWATGGPQPTALARAPGGDPR